MREGVVELIKLSKQPDIKSIQSPLEKNNLLLLLLLPTRGNSDSILSII